MKEKQMLFIVGASSLSRRIGKLHEPQYSRHVKSFIAEPGLSFKAFKQRKTVQYKLSIGTHTQIKFLFGMTP